RSTIPTPTAAEVESRRRARRTRRRSQTGAERGGGRLTSAPESGQDEHHLVDVAPAPVLAGLDRAGDRMPVLVCVTARMPGGRGGAAPDSLARSAHARGAPDA